MRSAESLSEDSTRRDGGLRLLVIGEEQFSAHPMPAEGRITIGRSATCDVRLDDPSVGAKHAEILAGVPPRIVDLGSPEGTRVRDVRIVPGSAVPLVPGELVRAGSVLLMLEQPKVQPQRRILTHGSFEMRVEEECHRADRQGRPFNVLAVRCRPADATARVEGVLASTLRLLDVVGCYSAGEYEVMLSETPVANVPIAVERLQRKLEEAGVEARLGAATYPRDAQSADALIERARAAAGAGAATRYEIEESGTAMQGLIRMVDRVAASEISVVIFGETGVGKEVLAQRVHRASPRAAKPLLSLNCAAFSESLLDSELFGHERGSFTGAHQAKAGLLENASGGTVFLDEVGDMPLSIQAKLLRVLEERKARRVGGLKPYDIDVRFIAATNRDLEAEVERGTFRKDLFFRLNGISFTIPPLRERESEIAGLSQALLRDCCRRGGVREPELPADVLSALRAYAWPGNVRELRNVIERALVLCGGGPITLAHLPMEKLTAHFATRAPGSRSIARAYGPPKPAETPASQDLRGAVEEFERQRIVDALEATAGNQVKAAKILNISRRTLVKRLSAYDIPRPRKGSRSTGAKP
jgi:two-component system, NtrC family, response regulator AtoC